MEIRSNQVYLGGVRALELAESFGTPLFVYEEDVVRERFRELARWIPYRPLVIHYASKANANLDILKTLHDEGAHIDACSPGDVHLALRAGFSPREIIYTGYGVSNDELSQIADMGLFVNMDSLSQLRRYGRIARHKKIGIRINPGITAGFHSHVAASAPSSKLGIPLASLEEAKTVAHEYDLSIACLHLHLGSDILELAPFLQALDILLEAAEHMPDLESIDVGGGWGVAYAASETRFNWQGYGAVLSERLRDWSLQRGRELILRIEPGTYLVAEAAYLLARVTDVKPGALCDGALRPTFVATDTSLNQLLPAALYDAYHEILIADRGTDDEFPRHPVHICGNLMQAGDVLARDRTMPEINEGDLLVFKTVGAYTSSRASRFNERPLPAEVLVKDGHAGLSRQRETLDDLLGGFQWDEAE